jgi:hypothetical protein
VVEEGIGMMYSPHAVFYGYCDEFLLNLLYKVTLEPQHAGFYGYCDDPSQNCSIGFHDDSCEHDEPLLTDLVRSQKIKNKAFSLLEAGAIPSDDYGHELYICPKCRQLFNRFFFQIRTVDGKYRPKYKCYHCRTLLKRVELEENNKTLTVVFKNNKKALWICPQCGNTKLAFGDLMIHWD